MTNATTAPDAIARGPVTVCRTPQTCRVPGLQYRDALDARAVARREQREFALQQWRRTASQMLKEIRPRREIASGKGGARTPKPRDYEAVFVLSPASECQSCLERRDSAYTARACSVAADTASHCFPGLAHLERCLRLREYLQVPTTLRHVQTQSDRADATRRVMTFRFHRERSADA